MPAVLAAHGVVVAVGSGDTWFLPPANALWADDVRWDAGLYFLKLGVWTTSAQPPRITVRQTSGAARLGSSSSTPTADGLPGPLPTTLRFPVEGCWEVIAQGQTGRARAVILVDASAKERR